MVLCVGAWAIVRATDEVASPLPVPRIEVAERLLAPRQLWWVWVNEAGPPPTWPLTEIPIDAEPIERFAAPPDDPAVDRVVQVGPGTYPDGWLADVQAPLTARGSITHNSLRSQRERTERSRRRDGDSASGAVTFVYPTGQGDGPPAWTTEMPEPGLNNLYACTAFQVDDPTRFAAFQMELEFATGMVAWLNGREVARHHVLPGRQGHGERSTHYWLPDHVFQMMYGRWQRTWMGLDPALLRAGTNLLCMATYKRDTAGDRALYIEATIDAWTAAGFTKTPYLQRVERQRVTVMWETTIPSFGYVEFGPEPGVMTRVASTPEIAGTHHEVVLTGLSANTRYQYRVTSVPTVDRPGQGGRVVSDTSTFRTAVERGTPFTFLLYGDNRTQPEIHTQVATQMWADAMRNDARFVVHTGDLVTNASPWWEWQREFFGPALPLMSTLPFYTSMGNHEGNHESYYHYLDLPNNEAWYSFSYGDVDYFALNSSLDFEPGSDQLEWLRQGLAASTAHWKIVFFHHPPYACTPARKPGDIDVQQYIVPVVEEFDVDLVLLGHDHLYGRTGTRNGVRYVISGGGGAPSYPAEADDVNEICEREFHYCRITVSGDTLEFKAITADGRVIDQFELQKP